MSSLPAESPLPLRTTHQVTSFDGTRIVYDLYPAPGRQTVLVVPGFWRTRRWPSMEQLARFLLRRGYPVAILDVRGHGDSGGRYEFNRNEHHDVAAVAHDLVKHHAVPALSLIGFSIGGSIAVCSVARHPDLPWRSLLLVAPAAKFSMIRPLLNPFTMHRHVSARNAARPPKFTWRFFTSPKLCAAEEIANVRVPVSFVHVRNDWLVSHRHSLMLHERAHDPKELHIFDIPGRWHADRILGVARDRSEGVIGDFLKRTLG